MLIDFQVSLPKRLNGQLYQNDIQGQIRKTAIESHTLIRGVAGSGKSMLLGWRVQRILSEKNYRRILILSFNRYMSSWLNRWIPQIAGHAPLIECKTFHSWAHQPPINYDYKEQPEVFLEKAIHARNQTLYDAILIDEAQDFHDQWFVGLLHLLNPNTNSLFLVYDNAQSVYGHPHRRKVNWTWRSLGINVVGRTNVLRNCYRNTPEILLTASNFIEPYAKRAMIPISDQGAGSIIAPRFILERSSNIYPVLYQVANFFELYNIISTEVRNSIFRVPNSSIAIMYPPGSGYQKLFQTPICTALANNGIRYHAPKESKERDGNYVDTNCVVVDSWKALKGVEFDAVIIIGADYMAPGEKDPDTAFSEIAGLYSAMTRARDHLVVLYGARTQIIIEIEHAINQAAGYLSQVNQSAANTSLNRY